MEDFFDSLWDIPQSVEISQNKASVERTGEEDERTEEEVERTGSSVHGLKTDIIRLQQRVDKMALICRAMWGMMQAEHGYTEEQLANKVMEVDLTDGKLDGKVQNKPLKCEGCNRQLHPRHTKCIYCGHQPKMQYKSEFDQV